MVDWREAGLKADATIVRNRYRETFDPKMKPAARRNAVRVLVAAGGTVCLDLWGGGGSAEVEVAAGLKVISVEDGSIFRSTEYVGPKMSLARMKRALERSGDENGYETHWGKAATFASEADVAFLDFCGPWSDSARRTVEACRHMKAVVVTLTSGHDIHTGATNLTERQLAYMVFLKLAFAGTAKGLQHVLRESNCKLLFKYRRPSGHAFVFLLTPVQGAFRFGPMTYQDRWALDPAKERKHYETTKRRKVERYQTDPEYRERIKQQVRAQKVRDRERWDADPEYRERRRKAGREYMARHRAKLQAEAEQ